MDFQQWWIDVVDFFSQERAEVFIHGSTLLGAVRDNKLLQRIPFDNELNFGIKAENLTLQLIANMRSHFPFVQIVGDLRRDMALIYFGPEPIIKYYSVNKSMWDMEPGFGLLAVFWRGKTKWVEYMGDGICLTWPLDLLERFSCLNLGQRTVSVPFDRHVWLSHYFGDDCMTEKQDWHWSTHSHNREWFDELKKKGEI